MKSIMSVNNIYFSIVCDAWKHLHSKVNVISRHDGFSLTSSLFMPVHTLLNHYTVIGPINITCVNTNFSNE